MKFNTIVKLVTALAAVVGAIYIVATYGDKLVEWAKSIMGCCHCKSAMNTPTAPAEDFVSEDAPQEAPAASEEAAEEPAAEEAAAEETTEAVLADDAIPVADEEDFEG